MKSEKVKLLLVALMFSINLSAQGEAAVPVLTLSQSPQLFGMGQVGVSVTFDDPLAFYHNPAILGFQSRDNNFSTSILTDKVNWMGRMYDFNVFGFNFGYNLERTFPFIPISVGLGYSKAKMSYGTYWHFSSNSELIGTASPYDEFSTISFGASLEYYSVLSFGISNKSVKSKIGARVTSDPNSFKEITVEKSLIDYGFLLEVPISQLILKNIKWNIDERNFLSPKTSFAIGYSLTNIGEDIYYTDPQQKDPLPRTARLGYNLNFGLDLTHNAKKINLLDYYFFAEADDILISNSQSGFEYQKPLSDLSFSKNLIQLKADNNILVHKAHMIELLEIVKLTSGSYYGRGFNDGIQINSYPKSSGFAVSSKGIFKILNILTTNKIISFVKEHIVIEYVQSSNFKGVPSETDFSAFNIYLKNFYF